ncbi:hypothetical protein [Helicovermis profundi]|uniref:Uncharacterized protein n=1 Tax=Helicovermis profundi TaxID=3065157 RepID=A0AAU9ENX4_9FIRM|nr:hypothetical protein HLPR_04960 [Clostridia bacterium S502]
MKIKVVIVILAIFLIVSLYINKDKKNLVKYNSVQKELKISKSDNKRMIKELEKLNIELDELKNNIAEKELNIESKDKESALTINNFDKYETRVFSTKNIEELFKLYGSNLDGAYAEAYGSKLYYFYNTIGELEFAEKLAKYNAYKINGIMYLLTSEMAMIYYNEGDIDINEYSKSLKNTLENNELNYREKEILYRIIADIEEMLSNKNID